MKTVSYIGSQARCGRPNQGESDFEEIEDVNRLPSKRPFGIAKGTIYMASDFDEPLDDLKIICK